MKALSVCWVVAALSASAAELPYEMDGTRFCVLPVKIFSSDATWPYAREPLLTRLEDGTLYCVLYSGGKQEPSPENVVLTVRSTDEGRTWSKPEKLISHPSRACWATEVYDFGKGPEILFQTFLADRHYAELRTYRTTVGADGRGPVEPVSLHGVPTSLSVRQVTRLENGTLILPAYWQENTGAWIAEMRYPDGVLDASGWNWSKWRFVTGVLRSTDGGNSWSVHGSLGNPAKQSVWEACAVELKGGRVRLYARVSGEGAGVLWSSDSADDGRTWSALRPTTIPNADTKPMVFRHNGRIYLLTNSCGPDWFDRRRIELWISADEGKTWTHRLVADAHKSTRCPNFICYPYGFVDKRSGQLFLCLDGKADQYFIRIPL